MATYRTASRVQVESGGALDELLDDVLRRVEESAFVRALFPGRISD